jgi:hypothetical protein
MEKFSTRLKYRQLHRCKANYESRAVKNGDRHRNATLPTKIVQLDRDATYVCTANEGYPSLAQLP